jgi:hypothetical protein
MSKGRQCCPKVPGFFPGLVPGSGSGSVPGSVPGSLSKPYIDPNPGAAHCWPISVHIRFRFKLYIFIKTLTKGAFCLKLNMLWHSELVDHFFVWISSSVKHLLLCFPKVLLGPCHALLFYAL